VEFVSNVYLVGEEKVIQCNIRDITERKQAQDALIKSEALLREQSVRDHLTGLFNRRYLEETLDRELLRASRKKHSIGIIMLDIDDFKRFNDTYGHAAGDEILRELGQILIQNVRGEDIPSRFGGDEFIIVLPDALREDTLNRAKLIHNVANRARFQFEGITLEVITLSVGVAIFPEDGTTGAAILKAADAALYKAKRTGRNQIMAAH
jgi:diguanylate cyclase (GGDEF)-like protein